LVQDKEETFDVEKVGIAIIVINSAIFLLQFYNILFMKLKVVAVAQAGMHRLQRSLSHKPTQVAPSAENVDAPASTGNNKAEAMAASRAENVDMPDWPAEWTQSKSDLFSRDPSTTGNGKATQMDLAKHGLRRQGTGVHM
jgi:hypothetical protein